MASRSAVFEAGDLVVLVRATVGIEPHAVFDPRVVEVRPLPARQRSVGRVNRLPHEVEEARRVVPDVPHVAEDPFSRSADDRRIDGLELLLGHDRAVHGEDLECHGDEEAGEDGDDRENDHQLDEREARGLRARAAATFVQHESSQ
jgi:hypothetical protein